MTTTYPPHHLSVRVPWHDAGWNGTVCQAPQQNGSCLKLPRIAENRNDEYEAEVAGKSIADLKPEHWPPCVSERVAFMAPFEYTRIVSHPYAKTSRHSYGHYAPTAQRNPAYSAPVVPFMWTRRENMADYGQTYNLDIDFAYEPDLGFETGWVQDVRNHRALLDCFFGHIHPEKSLCFFYAKKVPLVEDNGRRILIGVGFVTSIGPGLEYNYHQEGDTRSLIWERAVQHSIRPDFKEGFLLPYHAALQLAEEDPTFDPAEVVAFAPDNHLYEFSYTSEHVSHDGAIASLLACAAALKKAQQYNLEGPWERCLRWIDARLDEVWQMRGPCPGLGAALSAFGVEMGTFIAHEIDNQVGQNEDPWPLVDQIFQDPAVHLPPELARQIGQTLRETWAVLAPERLALLQLLSRFEIKADQAKFLFRQEDRQQAGIDLTDQQILENPYLIYESTRHDWEWAVSVHTVDRGVFPVDMIRTKHPLPAPSALDAGTDKRRVRALAVNVLEQATTNQGHTLLSRQDVTLKIRGLEMDPPCEVTQDLMNVVDASLDETISLVKMANGLPAYQLKRLSEVGALIQRTVSKRLRGKRHAIQADWRAMLDARLPEPVTAGDELEELARQEKAKALEELAASRISVLIGPAGTGKTTLLSVLCQHEEIAAGDVLLLAPTGKARVRMQDVAKDLNIRALTLAQFLNRCSRYDGKNQRYILSNRPKEETARTVIVDEASMLTEEMLGALLDGIRGVHRLILVGDPQQLPPIGPGRPFVDIVTRLAPETVENQKIRVGPGYAELTVPRRQVEATTEEGRPDIQLAKWFSGRPLGPGEDDVFDLVAGGQATHIQFKQWDTPEEFQTALLETLVEELSLEGGEDVDTFDLSLGGTKHGHSIYFNRGAASFIEDWQILSPVRGLTHGVTEINRLIHKTFKARTLKSARRWKNRKIPKPMGVEEVVYGDKVINLTNRWHHTVWPKEDALEYVANGEIGIAVGQFKSKKMTKAPRTLKVEFSSQPGFQYDYTDRDFDDETGAALELAYALTVHKSQGSEFGKIILVLPNPCFLLSRELLYTALTRQKDRIVILHQGSRSELKKYASDGRSATASRLTNLFEKPNPVEVEGTFLEERLIHRTSDGTAVRSKSEVIVYDRLLNAGLEPVYEQALTLNGVTKYPDFTIEDEDTGLIYYWEHCGLMHDPSYRQRWEKKLAWYRHNDILPYEEGGGDAGTLIVTEDTDVGGISSQEIDQVIEAAMMV